MKIIFNPLTGKFDYVVNKLTELSSRNHNDLQNRDAAAAHPAEAVGVISPSSMFPQDIGKNWKDLGIPSGGGGTMTLLNFSNGVIVCFQSGANNFRSIDYGATWNDTGVNTFIPTPLSRTYLGNGIGIIGTNTNAIKRTTDFGLTWTDIIIDLSPISNVCYLGNGIVIAWSISGHGWRSTDYGLTWADLGVIPGGTMTYFDNGIVVSVNGSRSTDYGLTWTGVTVSVSNGTKVIYLGNGVGVLGTQDQKVFRTTDYGETWTDLGITLPVGEVLSGDYFGNGVVVFGGSGTDLSRSTDYGLTWETISSTILAADDLVYMGNGVGIIADGGSHIFRSDIAFKLDEAQLNFPEITNIVNDIRRYPFFMGE